MWRSRWRSHWRCRGWRWRRRHASWRSGRTPGCRVRWRRRNPRRRDERLLSTATRGILFLVRLAMRVAVAVWTKFGLLGQRNTRIIMQDNVSGWDISRRGAPRGMTKKSTWRDGDRSNLDASCLLSKRVARWTRVSAVSQMMSLIASLGSILSRCCRILRNGISWGVSAIWRIATSA